MSVLRRVRFYKNEKIGGRKNLSNLNEDTKILIGQKLFPCYQKFKFYIGILFLCYFELLKSTFEFRAFAILLIPCCKNTPA